MQRSNGNAAAAEQVDIVSFMGDPQALGIDGETGTFSTSVGSREQRFEIDFANSYDNPVLFLHAVGAGGNPFSVQPVSVKGGAALIGIAEPANYDGVRTGGTLTVQWAVFEAGHYTLADGRVLEVGAFDAAAAGYDMADGITLTPTFENTAGSHQRYADDVAIIAQPQRGPGNVYQGVRMERSTASLMGTSYLASVTMRHMRRKAVESSDRPEATVGPIGYMIVGDVIESYQMSSHTPWQVDESATSMTVLWPRAVIKALGADADTFETTVTYNSTHDALSIVRIGAVKLLTPAGEALNAVDSSIVPDDIDRGDSFVRVEFSDGTSAFYLGGSGSRLQAKSGGANGVKLSSGSVGRSNRFHVISNADGTVSLSSYKGYYMSLQNGSVSTSGATEIGDAERFLLLDMAQLASSSTPNLRLDAADLDGDGEHELIVLAEQDDGTGYFVADPLGMMDLLYKAGYQPSDAFIGDLSTTQKDGLLEQLEGLPGVTTFDDIDAALVLQTFNAMDAQGLTRSYTATEFEYALEGSLYETQVGGEGYFGATVSVGEYELMVDNDEFGTGYQFSATLLKVEHDNGYYTTTIAVGTVYYACDVDSDGFAFGGGVELISVTVMVGDEDGSYVSVSAGIGTGWYVAGSFGQNDQYGFTLDLPVLPVAVSVYVHSDDIADEIDQVSVLSIEDVDGAASFAADAWSTVSTIVQNNLNIKFAKVDNVSEGAEATVTEMGSSALVFAADETGQVIDFVDDVSTGLTPIIDEVGDGLGNILDDASDGWDEVEDFFDFGGLFD